jgi:hypothetical protein
MQAIIVSALGDSSSLQLRTDVAVPTAAPGHTLVKLQFSGVNYIDTYFRSGLYPTQLPYTPGAPPCHRIKMICIHHRCPRTPHLLLLSPVLISRAQVEKERVLSSLLHQTAALTLATESRA